MLSSVFLVAAAEPPTTRPAGKSSVAWPLPEGAAFEKSYTAYGTRYGFKIPDNYPQKKRDEWLSASGVAEPTYELYVPPEAGPGGKYGLLVWISAGGSGKVPREDWLKVLDRHHLLWVGPNHVGNETDALLRAYVALEAVRNAKREFPIDDARVYVAGISGGGRIASHAALVAADTFTGGFYFVGCDFYRDVPVVPNDKHGKYYRGFWRKPDPKILKLARQHRYVLLTGSDDFNRGNTHAVHDGYRKAGFDEVVLFDVPGLGHTLPNAEWFEKGIKVLDGAPPTTKPATGSTTRPRGVIRVGPSQKPVR